MFIIIEFFKLKNKLWKLKKYKVIIEEVVTGNFKIEVERYDEVLKNK